jgi:hypothetical protein
MLIAGIIISPHARWALSRPPFLWLGKVSFAIYLVHGMFLRTVFAWILHLGQSKETITDHDQWGQEVHDERYPLPGFFQRALATVAMGLCVMVASHLWNLKFEPIFAKITSKSEAVVAGKVEVKELKPIGGPLLPLRKD